MSLMYNGDKLFKALYVSKAILYLILKLTGSQWISLKTGVILENLNTVSNIRATWFWIFCSFDNCDFGALDKTELQ